MGSVYGRLDTFSAYRDNKSGQSHHEQIARLQETKTLYVGNLSFYTTEEQIYELFSKAGSLRRVIMGLDRNTKTPCGFCFVEYYTHEDALDALKFVSGTKLDERPIRADLDPGFLDGRQYGRGKSGGQVRDEHREDYDVGRGGFGKGLLNREELYRNDHDTAGLRDVPLGETGNENPRFAEDRGEQDEEEVTREA